MYSRGKKRDRSEGACTVSVSFFATRIHVPKQIFFISFVIFLSLPFAAHATVLINEVAWMGTSASPNDEWIELYNNGTTSVALNGWTLGDGASLVIPFVSTLGAGEYAVLERTDDSTVSDVVALLTYTGALSNNGRTLTLYRGDGGIEDQVIGGADWKNIGGDNTTKYTAQRTATDWTTAPPTPGKQNASPKINRARSVSDTPPSNPMVSTKNGVNPSSVTQTTKETLKESPSLHRYETVTPVSTSTQTIAIGKPQPTSVGAAENQTTNRSPYFGLIGVIAIATIGLYVWPRQRPMNE